MRQWALAAGTLTTDGVAFTAAASGSLTQAANKYFVLVGGNVAQYRRDELIAMIDWLTEVAIRNFDTTRFPRPSGSGVRGTFLKAKMIGTTEGMKKTHTLVTSTDMTTHPLSDNDAVYVGITAQASPPTVNYAWKMGAQGLVGAMEKIKNAILQKLPSAISSIDVQPATTTKAAAATQQLTVVATYADSSTEDITTRAAYTTSNAAKATCNSAGLITAVATGSATITATYRGQTDTCVVTVS